jgi:metal-responsive CopG/Arc/MetJ family transcriptional regulator
MRIVQMTLDDELVAEVDRTVRRLRTTRSAFTRAALRDALERVATRELERRHRQGYKAKPGRRGEFEAWEKEQVWPE